MNRGSVNNTEEQEFLQTVQEVAEILIPAY